MGASLACCRSAAVTAIDTVNVATQKHQQLPDDSTKHDNGVTGSAGTGADSEAQAARASPAPLSPAHSRHATALSSPSSLDHTKPMPAISRAASLNISFRSKYKDVKRTAFAQCLDHDELQRFSELFEVCVVDAEQIIFKQGAVADMFYIIRRGEVSIKFSDRESSHHQSQKETNSKDGSEVASPIMSPGRKTLIAPPISPRSKNTPPRAAARSVFAQQRERRANSVDADFADNNAANIFSTTATNNSTNTAAGTVIGTASGKGIGKKSNHHHHTHTHHNLKERILGSVDELKATDSPKSVARKLHDHPESNGDSRPRPLLSYGSNKSSSHNNIHNIVSTNSPNSLSDSDSHCSVERQRADSSVTSATVLTTKSMGDSFGPEALRIGQQYRTSSCISVSECVLLGLSSHTFHSFVESLDDDTKKKKLYDLVGDSIQECLQKMPYLSGVSAAKLSLLSSLFVWTILPAKKILFTEGERDKKGNGLYFLYQGLVGVYIRDDSSESKLIKELTAGVCFGELGLIIHLPRTATITAHARCLLLHLPYRSFHNFLHLTPEILTKFKEQIETYQLNVVYLLENEVIAQYFFQHCSREYSTENLEFWWEAKNFRQMKFLTDSDRVTEAERIMSLYITDSSPKQINLKGNTQKNILNALTPNSLSPRHPHASTNNSTSTTAGNTSVVKIDNDLYVEAENEILNLLATDSFSRFKSSPLFRDCLEAMNNNGRASLSIKDPVPNVEASPSGSQSVGSFQDSSRSPSPSSSPKCTMALTLKLTNADAQSNVSAGTIRKQSFALTPINKASAVTAITAISKRTPQSLSHSQTFQHSPQVRTSEISPKNGSSKSNNRSSPRSSEKVSARTPISLKHSNIGLLGLKSSPGSPLRRTNTQLRGSGKTQFATLGSHSNSSAADSQVTNGSGSGNNSGKSGREDDEAIHTLNPNSGSGRNVIPKLDFQRTKSFSNISGNKPPVTPTTQLTRNLCNIIQSNGNIVNVPECSNGDDTSTGAEKRPSEGSSTFRDFMASRANTNEPLILTSSSTPSSARTHASIAAKKRATLQKPLTDSESPLAAIAVTVPLSQSSLIVKSKNLQLTRSSSFRASRSANPLSPNHALSPSFANR